MGKDKERTHTGINNRMDYYMVYFIAELKIN